jgi:hypothetical protein
LNSGPVRQGSIASSDMKLSSVRSERSGSSTPSGDRAGTPLEIRR